MITLKLEKIDRLLDDVDYYLFKASQYCSEAKSNIDVLILAFGEKQEAEDSLSTARAVNQLFKVRSFIEDNLDILSQMRDRWRFTKFWYSLRSLSFRLLGISNKLIYLEVLTGMLNRADINTLKAQETAEAFSADLFEDILQPIHNFRETSSEIHNLLTEIDNIQPDGRTTWGNLPKKDEYFVDPQRIKELKAIKSRDFDLTRLLRICNEMNQSYTNGNYLSVTMLTRSLLDHIPPILQCRNFSEVANNYAGTRSFREAMQHLDKASRKIADAHLHVQIRAKEVLPNKTQVNFANEIDVLLSEIVRLLK